MKQFRIEIKWAIIHAGVMLLWVSAERLTGLHTKHIDLQQNISILILLPVILIYVLANLDKRKQVYGGDMTYVQGFMCGIGLTVCILILTPVVQFISSYLISPHFFENLITYSVDRGIYTRDQAARQFTFTNFVFTNMIFQMITGVVFSAFVPIWTKSSKESM